MIAFIKEAWNNPVVMIWSMIVSAGTGGILLAVGLYLRHPVVSVPLAIIGMTILMLTAVFMTKALSINAADKPATAVTQ
jgi:hypothetical protein